MDTFPKNLKNLLGEGPKEALDVMLGALSNTQKKQANLMRVVQRALLQGSEIPASSFHAQGYGICSRQDEDGLILHILRNIGVKNRTFVEIGVQDGLECNTANLSRNLGWSGLLLEGDEALAEAAQKNYCGFPNVVVKHAFVTRENVAQILANCAVDRNGDLFSMDIDGNDYWIWDAMEDFLPRIVVIEYNHALGAERSVTIPYDPEFRYRSKYPRGYMGASLRAFQRLGERKGYALVGSSNLGPNAFFVLKSELKGELQEISVEEAHRPLYLKRRGVDFPKTLDALEFEEV